MDNIRLCQRVTRRKRILVDSGVVASFGEPWNQQLTITARCGRILAALPADDDQNTADSAISVVYNFSRQTCKRLSDSKIHFAVGACFHRGESREVIRPIHMQHGLELMVAFEHA